MDKIKADILNDKVNDDLMISPPSAVAKIVSSTDGTTTLPGSSSAGSEQGTSPGSVQGTSSGSIGGSNVPSSISARRAALLQKKQVQPASANTPVTLRQKLDVEFER